MESCSKPEPDPSGGAKPQTTVESDNLVNEDSTQQFRNPVFAFGIKVVQEQLPAMVSILPSNKVEAFKYFILII